MTPSDISLDFLVAQGFEIEETCNQWSWHGEEGWVWVNIKYDELTLSNSHDPVTISGITEAKILAAKVLMA